MGERLVNLTQTQKECIAHLTRPSNPAKSCRGCPNDLLISMECQVRYTKGVHRKVGAPLKQAQGVSRAPKMYDLTCLDCGEDYTARSIASRHAGCPAAYG